MENLGLEMRKQVVRYLARELSIAELQVALAPLAWNADRRADPASAALAHDLDLLLAEFSHGDWSEDEIRQRLRPVVANYIVQEDSRALVTSSSSSSFSNAPISWVPASGSSFDIRPVKASV